MSQWTHVQGCLLLSSGPFEFKKIKVEKPAKREDNEEAWEEWRNAYYKSAYLPYPEEQFKMSVPVLRNKYNYKTDKEEACLDIERITLYSLPRARKYIEEAFKLLPYGETGFTYAIKQDRTNCRSSSSSSEFPCLKKYLKDAVNKLYYTEDYFYSLTYEDLKKYNKLDDDPWIDYVDEIVIGIVEDLRYCSAQDLEEGLEKFIKYLESNDIDICGGLLEFIDEWEENTKHVFRVSQFEGYTFETINTTTNKVIKRKTYSYPKDEKGWNDYDKFEESGWVIKEEEIKDE